MDFLLESAGNFVYTIHMINIPELLLGGWAWKPVTYLVLAVLSVLYARGWRRLHTVDKELATVGRLGAFGLGVAALLLAHASPLFVLRGEFLTARASQQVLLGMIAPPLLWIACPFHMLARGLPARWRRGLTHALLRPTATRRAVKFLTQPLLTWLLMISAFLTWHDPSFAAWTLRNGWTYSLVLWLLFGAYFLFWWHLIGTAPRLHPAMSVWVAFAYLILGAEIPNMLAGVSIAFTPSPIYRHFGSAQSGPLGINDQILSGGIIWVTGSVVYISSAILIVNRLFRQEEMPPPRLPIERFATERSIAPGLERRVIQERWRELEQRKK